jgi:hypothetical protein
MLGIGLGVTSVQQGIGLISDPGSGPEGSTASANFAAGTYDGVEDLSDFLAENTAWGMFDPATVVDGIGLTDPDANSNAAPVLATALATELLADGFSAVFTYTRTAAIGVLCGITIEMLDLPDFNNEWIVGCVGADGTGYIFDAPTTDHHMVSPIQGPGQHKAAFTLSDGTIALSVDGSDAISATPGAASPNSIALQTVGGIALESFVIYPPKTNAEIKVLSA